MTYALTFRTKVRLDRTDALPKDTPRFFSPSFQEESASTPVYGALLRSSPRDPLLTPQDGLCPLDQTDKATEDRKNPFWRSLTGAPRRWMMFDGRRIRLVPASVVNVTVGYLEAPTEMVNDGDTPDTRIPVPHQAYLKFCAAAFLLRQDGDQQDEAKAQSFIDTFNSLIGVKHG